MVSTLASKLDGLIMSTSSPPHIDNRLEESLLADIEHYPTHDLKFLLLTDVQRGCGIIFIPAPARGRSFSTANSEPARFGDRAGRVAKHIAAAARARGRRTWAVCALLLVVAREPLLNETRIAQARGFSL